MLRKNKLPKPRLQATMIAMFVVVGALGLIVHFTMAISKLGAIFGSDPARQLLIDKVQVGLLEQLWLTLALMIPVFATVGMFITFRVAGPLVALERYLTRLADGEDPGDCQFRKGDELGELSAVATRVGERMRALTAEKSLEPEEEPVR